MDVDIPASFSVLGFSDSETRVYLALLDLGHSTIGPISSKSRIQPTKAYQALEKLTGRGLVSYTVQSKARYFQTNDPEQILNIIREKEQEIKSILPILKQKQKAPRFHQIAIVHEGIESMRSLYDSFIRKMEPGDFYYSFALKNEYLHSDSARIFFRQKNQQMSEKGVDDRVIVRKDVEKEFATIFSDIPGINFRFTDLHLPLGLTIMKDRIIHTVWTGKPTSFEIVSPILAGQYTEVFLQAWENIKSE